MKVAINTADNTASVFDVINGTDLNQKTDSYHILGTRLFLRNSRAVALTEAGRQFEKDLIQIANQLQAAKNTPLKLEKAAGRFSKLHVLTEPR